jgi:hypothetical protein
LLSQVSKEPTPVAHLHQGPDATREQLIVATCEVVPKWSGEDRRRDPSRCFALIQAEVDETIDLRRSPARP